MDAGVDAGLAEEPEVAATAKKAPKKKSKKTPRIRTSWPRECNTSNDYLRRIVGRHISEVKHCYEKGLASRPELEGRVAVSWTISEVGAVKKAKVASTTLNHKPTEDCIVAAVRRWTFPQPCGGGEVKVTYPFQLTPPE